MKNLLSMRAGSFDIGTFVTDPAHINEEVADTPRNLPLEKIDGIHIKVNHSSALLAGEMAVVAVLFRIHESPVTEIRVEVIGIPKILQIPVDGGLRNRRIFLIHPSVKVISRKE